MTEARLSEISTTSRDIRGRKDTPIGVGRGFFRYLGRPFTDNAWTYSSTHDSRDEVAVCDWLWEFTLLSGSLAPTLSPLPANLYCRMNLLFQEGTHHSSHVALKSKVVPPLALVNYSWLECSVKSAECALCALLTLEGSLVTRKQHFSSILGA